MKNSLAVAALLLLAPGLVGWDHVLSPDAFFSVNPRVSYAEVKRDPEAHKGTTLMLGGLVADNLSSREGTALEILCYALDRDDRPEELDEDCGRFLAKTGEVLDPERYAPGRLVTLTGTVIGRETEPLGDDRYDYPVFEIGEIYPWPTPEERYRYPYYYYDPYWDPFYPYPWWRRHPYYRW